MERSELRWKQELEKWHMKRIWMLTIYLRMKQALQRQEEKKKIKNEGMSLIIVTKKREKASHKDQGE